MNEEGSHLCRQGVTNRRAREHITQQELATETNLTLSRVQVGFCGHRRIDVSPAADISDAHYSEQLDMFSSKEGAG